MTRKQQQEAAWRLEDINILEQELLSNIEKLDYPDKVIKRAARLISNRLSMERAFLHAVQLLRENER